MTLLTGRPAYTGAIATARRCHHEAALLRDTAIDAELTDMQRTLLMREAEMSERLAHRCAVQADKKKQQRPNVAAH